MNYLESVEILGFWGTKNVKLEFKQDLNFIIGENGTGKTTIINLIAAALRADIRALYSVQFDKITLRLKALGSNRKPIIEVIKSDNGLMGSIDLKYQVRNSTRGEVQTYGVEGPYDERVYGDRRYIPNQMLRKVREQGAKLNEVLANFVEVNWLSIHRTTITDFTKNQRETSPKAAIDKKLDQISGEFASYFSVLNSKAELENKNFQEHVFLSLLRQKNSAAGIFGPTNQTTAEKDPVIRVLTELGVAPTKAKESVNKHYNRLAKAQDRRNDPHERGTITVDDAITLSDSVRVTELIEEWTRLENKRRKIFQPKIQFEDILNKLFRGKELHFDERNIPKVHLSSGEKVDINILSSGEKQLFILLGEALLQEDRPVIFISDEPELSLHVSWQNSLFKNIRKLNIASQIIAATHSPDIVSEFQDRVIKIEECLTDVH